MEKRIKLDPQEWEITAVLPEEVTASTLPTDDAWAIQINDKRQISKLIKFLEAERPFQYKFIKRVNATKDGALVLYDFCGFDDDDIKRKLTGFEGAKVIKVKAPTKAPLTRKQFEEGREFWPIHFFESKDLEALLSRTRSDIWGSEKSTHVEHMVRATGATNAVAVSPTSGRVIATAEGDSSHPMKHACMVLIDNVARTQGGGAWGPKISDKSDDSYLLTGCDVYTGLEPCIMCSMALVHSRVRRVYFNRPSKEGACQTLVKMNTISELNHSYEVFQMTCIS